MNMWGSPEKADDRRVSVVECRHGVEQVGNEAGTIGHCRYCEIGRCSAVKAIVNSPPR